MATSCKICKRNLIFEDETVTGYCHECLDELDKEMKEWPEFDEQGLLDELEDPFPGDFWGDNDF